MIFGSLSSLTSQSPGLRTRISKSDQLAKKDGQEALLRLFLASDTSCLTYVSQKIRGPETAEN